MLCSAICCPLSYKNVFLIVKMLSPPDKTIIYMALQLLEPQNPLDQLLNICSLIIKDGATMLDMSSGQFAILLFGLLAVSVISFLISASLALTRRKLSRVMSIVMLNIGCVSLVTFISFSAYAVIYGSNWAREISIYNSDTVTITGI